MKIKKFRDYEKMKATKRSFQPNSDRQNFTTNTRNEFDPITRKITQFTEDEIDDILEETPEEIQEKKSTKSESIEDCPSFSDFNKAIMNLKKITKKISSELKNGKKSDIDDYIERKIFGRDV